MSINTQLTGISYYVPEKIITNNDLSAYLDTSDEWIQKKIGIKERRIASPTEVASDLATKAAEKVLKQTGISASEIDMIILATNTPDHLSPATAIKLQKKILANNAFAFDIRVGGCPGLVYGITIGSKFINEGSCKTVLVATSDLNSRGIDWNDRLTAVIMGDGASAIILQKSESKSDGKLIKTELFTDPSGYYAAYIPAGGTEEPFSIEGYKQNRHFFKMDGKEIFNFATKVFPESVEKIVFESGLDLKDIDYIIPHQANINIIKKSMEKLKMPMSKTYCNLEKYGNTGGSSIGIALGEAIEKKVIKKGDTIVLVAYGAGLCWGTVLLEL